MENELIHQLLFHYVLFSGTLLGLNQAVAKDCLSSHCRAVAVRAGECPGSVSNIYDVLIKGGWSSSFTNQLLETFSYTLETRRNTTRAVISVDPVSSLTETEAWKLGNKRKGTDAMDKDKANTNKKAKEMPSK